MNAATLADRRAALFARTATPVLIVSLLAVGERPAEEDQRMVRAWIIDELEKRHPVAAEEVADIFEDAERRSPETGEWIEVPYVSTLLAAIERNSR